ncbi:MAG: histidine kinase dimerization/phosphoacceptor domain -containing protein, partial [Ignavibacteria bacterium]
AREVAEKKKAEEELFARNEQVIKQQAALIELSKLKESNLETTFKKITEITSPPLKADRTSIWLFNPSQSEIECKEMYVPANGTHTSGMILKNEEFYDYFNAKNSIPFTTHDPENDPRTKEFTQTILHPFGTIIIIISRLRLKGEVVGMICFESINPAKTDWSPEEYDFSLSVAGFISMILEASERNKAENAMMNSLKEKELLLKEIHHRVKNNLSVISSLLYLQSKNISDRKQAEVFLECQSRVRTMVLVHEKLYQSKDIGRIDYSDYIKGLSEYLIHSFVTDDTIIKIDIDVKDVYLTLDTAINCGLVINELLSNSLKYAFKGRKEGKIDIKLYNMGDNKFYLSIKDDGAGMPASINFKQTSTLGLQLVTTLVDQLEGTINMDNSSGTHYEIQFLEKPQN